MTNVSRVVAIKGEQELLDPQHFGAKAAGLASLPGKWTPPFFAVAAGALDEIENTTALQAQLQQALNALGPCSDGLITRSSGTGEGLSDRGAFDSYRCEPVLDDVIQNLRRVAGSSPEGDHASLGFVVQRWIAPAACGHLSNERRVSQDCRRWVWELEITLSSDEEDRSFPLRVDSKVKGEPSLRCASFEDIPKGLRAIARHLTRPNPRCHMEWIWDGERIWVVQRDDQHAESGVPPASDWNFGPVGGLTQPMKLFKRAADIDTVFPKAEHVRTFAQADLPAGDVRILYGSRVIQRLSRGEISRELGRDLRKLIAEPVVVRTDIKADATHPALMSARTDVCMTYDQLAGFLVDTAKHTLDLGIPPSEVAFLAHRFLLAEAGAYGFARPGSSRVLIDATWGIPDSLLFHPHDSFRVDIDTRKVERHLRCKTDFIDVDANGRWQSRAAGVPWDWRSALRRQDALTVADMCAKLADSLEVEVEVMFFIGPQSLEARILPWFFSAPKQPLFEVEQSRGYYSGDRLTIRNGQDLAEAEQALSRSHGSRITLTIRPQVEYLRSKDFLQRIAAVAQRFGAPVELEGSRLSHAYYLLEDAGARVRCVDPWGDSDQRQAFGKLVRDLIPVRIQRRGEQVMAYSADRQELAALIRAKMIEEAVEYYWARDSEASVEELADLLELLRAAAKVHGVAFRDVERAARRKRKERGGFEGGVVLVETHPGRSAFGESGPTVAMASLITHDREFTGRLRPGIAERKVVRLPGRRLVLPVAPPNNWAENRPHDVILDAEEEAVVTYGPTTIQVQIRPRQKGPGRDQLSMEI